MNFTVYYERKKSDAACCQSHAFSCDNVLMVGSRWLESASLLLRPVTVYSSTKPPTTVLIELAPWHSQLANVTSLTGVQSHFRGRTERASNVRVTHILWRR